MPTKRPSPAGARLCAPARRRAACPPKPRLEERPLLTRARADDLGQVFRVLISGTRLRLLPALARAGAPKAFGTRSSRRRAGEMCVTDLANAVRMKPQAVSNQL